MTLTTIHSILSNTVWMFYLALGLWGLFRAIRKQGVDGGYLGAMVIIQVLVLLQGLMGGYLWLIDGARPGRGGIHVLYGLFSIVFLPFLFAYQRGDDSDRAQWVYALACLFMFGVAERLIATGV